MSETETETKAEKPAAEEKEKAAEPGTPVEAAQEPLTTRHEAPARPSLFLAHDLLVVVLAAVVLVGAHFAHAAMTRPRLKVFDHQGLTVSYPAGWFPSTGDVDQTPTEVTYASNDAAEPFARLEIRIAPKPDFDGPIQAVLDLGRGRRYGDLYKRLSSDTVRKGGVDWLCTRFSYAFKPSDEDAPLVASAAEYAIVNGERLYVVTVHGSSERLPSLESTMLANLAVR